jgi:LPXTG-motif cell wall-anchored protein
MNIRSPQYTQAYYGATSALSSDPMYGNIGYANRVAGVGDFWDSLGQIIGGTLRLTGVDLWAQNLLGETRRSLLQGQGYQFMEAVEIGGRQGVKVKAPDGTFSVIFNDGSSIPYTANIQNQARPVDPNTGVTSGAVMGVAAVVGIGLLAYFILRKRR